MSYDGIGVSDRMLDSLSLQLREAELRRTEAERAHQDALNQLRISSSGLGAGRTTESIETLQSRTREFEKKAALETVRCEELQLELSAVLKSKSASGTSRHHNSQFSTIGATTVTWAPTPTKLQSQQHNHHIPITVPTTSISSTDILKMNHGNSGNVGTGTEIDRIIAKIEQDNRILAELEQPRTTGPSLTATCKSSSIKPSSLLTSFSATGTSTITSGANVRGISSSTSTNALTNFETTLSSNNVGATVNLNLGSATTTGLSSTSTTMPVLSLHNTYTLPSGSASYTLGLSGAPNVASYSYPTSVGVSTFDRSLLPSGVSSAAPNFLSGITGLPSTSLNPFAYSTYTNPLLAGSGTSRLNMRKPYDDLELIVGGRYGPRPLTPTSPIPTGNWGLDGYLDGVNPAFMHSQRSHSRLGALDLETRHGYILNGNGEPQVDMLDIPGKGRCCVFIARFSYDPPDDSEGELTLSAGDYLLVWGSGDPQSGYFDAELLDGRRGLVPASFVQRLIGDDLLEFHQAVVSTLRDADEAPVPLDPAPLPPNIPPTNPLLTHTSEDLARLNEIHCDFGTDQNDDESDNVPAPQHLSLERQLNKSVLIGWAMPDPPGCQLIESYHVYVDGVLKVTVKANERTRALVEGVDLNKPHRISVRSVTHDRRTSRDAACTMIIGRDTSHLGPSAVRASNITCSSAMISWLPANTNHHHVVCVNNVEVRVVKPGVYRQLINGLSPSSQYRVTVRAKHSRAPGQPPQHPPPEEAPGAYTDFRTLTKGLPDPPQDIQVEPGPQDGTLLVTWQTVTRPPSSGPVTGYAVYADGKKVTDVDSPTGDHALIDIGKLVGLNPRTVTVRTKSRESTSADSQPTMIPNGVRNAARNRHHQHQNSTLHSAIPSHMRNQQQPQQHRLGPMTNQQHQPMGPNQPQPVLDYHDENLSDKEIYPGSIHQTGSGHQVGPMHQGHNSMHRQQQQQRPGMNMNSHQPMQKSQMQQQQPQQQRALNPGPAPNIQQVNQSQQMMQNLPQPTQQQQQQQQQQKKIRYFMAMFDYDPTTMSPNPDGCEEELPFQEGDTIKVIGDKDQDGFYWGELRGRRGFVPHNMVSEIDENQVSTQGASSTSAAVPATAVTGGSVGVQQSVRNVSRERWGDIYCNMPVKRMIALYDYDPQELSPNVDAEQVELSFKTGEVILVYGDMDEDGFFMGELDGVRGLVPSNFLTEAPEQYNNQTGNASTSGLNAQRNQGTTNATLTAAQRNNNRISSGPGARGPPPPPRDNISGTTTMRDARPTSPTLLDNTGHPAHEHQTQMIGMDGTHKNRLAPTHPSAMIPSTSDSRNETGDRWDHPTNGGKPIFGSGGTTNQQQRSQQQQQQQQPFSSIQSSEQNKQQSSGIFSTASNLLSGASNATNLSGGLFGNRQSNVQRGPQVIPQTNSNLVQQQHQQQQHQQPFNNNSGSGGNLFGFGNQQQPQQQQMNNNMQQGGQPNLMQKLGDITANAPGGDILSKGKELIFMKFGLGGK